MYEVYKYVLEILKVSSLPKQPTLTDVIPLYDSILSEFYKLKGWVRREVKTLFQNLHPPTQTQILFYKVCQQIFAKQSVLNGLGMKVKFLQSEVL